MMPKTEKTKKRLLLKAFNTLWKAVPTTHPYNGGTTPKAPIKENDLLQETTAVANAVEDVAEEIHEQKVEVLQVQLEELKLEKEMLKSQIATANLSVLIFRITLFSTFIALLSLLIALLRTQP